MNINQIDNQTTKRSSTTSMKNDASSASQKEGQQQNPQSELKKRRTLKFDLDDIFLLIVCVVGFMLIGVSYPPEGAEDYLFTSMFVGALGGLIIFIYYKKRRLSP